MTSNNIISYYDEELYGFTRRLLSLYRISVLLPFFGFVFYSLHYHASASFMLI